MSLINREALYEKACGLEAQALAYVGKIANDETRTEEWRIWSAILAERTAFKHDIFDAPEVKPTQLERCPIYRAVCDYPSYECYDCPRHDPTRIANKLMMPEPYQKEGDE